MKETRILDHDDAKGFLQNMRWFADSGRVAVKPIGNNKFEVTANRSSWSHWANDDLRSFRKEYDDIEKEYVDHNSVISCKAAAFNLQDKTNA